MTWSWLRLFCQRGHDNSTIMTHGRALLCVIIKWSQTPALFLHWFTRLSHHNAALNESWITSKCSLVCFSYCLSIVAYFHYFVSSELTPLQATGGGVKIITSPNLHCQRIESDGSNCTNGPIRGQRDREHSVISSLPPLFSHTEDKHLSYHNPHTSKDKLLLFFISSFYRRKK